jgi:hypothetical protein
MYTRTDYLNKKCTHDEYYGQFVTDGFISTVCNIIGKKKILESTDPHLNDIPLTKWDAIVHNRMLPLGTGEKMKEAGDYLTPSGGVCIAKCAARRIKEAGQ